jgi:hypothetical protein
VEVNVTKVPALSGFDCTLLKDEDYMALVTAYNAFQFVCFIFAITCLIVLYSLIGRRLYQLRSFKFYSTDNKPQSDKGDFVRGILVLETVEFECFSVSG